MKKILFTFLCISTVILFIGCQNSTTRAPEGAVIGGVLGAAAGGIVGSQSHHAGEGLAIGAAAGALTGAIVGSQINKPGQEVASSTQMTMMQIVDLTKKGVREDEIVDKIKVTNSKFNLTPNDIAALKQQGVTQKVIDAMQGK